MLHLHLSESLRETMVNELAVMFPQPHRLLNAADRLRIYIPDVSHASLYVPDLDKRVPKPVFEHELIVPVTGLTTHEIGLGFLSTLNTIALAEYERRVKARANRAIGIGLTGLIFGATVAHGAQSNAGDAIGFGTWAATAVTIGIDHAIPLHRRQLMEAASPVIVDRMTPPQE